MALTGSSLRFRKANSVLTDITQIQEPEYDAILRQAVAVIDRTRAIVATAVSSAIGSQAIFVWL